MLAHYTENNSPLTSNQILSLQLDATSGLLYIATERGLQTFQTGSTAFSKEQRSRNHAYPNPLRPEDPDQITLTGLVAGVEIKVIDRTGELILEAVSSGATLSFNARRTNGDRPPGIYTALLRPLLQAFAPRAVCHYLAILYNNNIPNERSIFIFSLKPLRWALSCLHQPFRWMHKLPYKREAREFGITPQLLERLKTHYRGDATDKAFAKHRYSQRNDI